MRRNLSALALTVSALMLAGCSSGLLGGKSHVQQANNVPVGNSLTMPPDLSLATPGQTTNAYRPNPAPVVETEQAAITEGDFYGASAAAPATAQSGDVYAKYNISKTKPDGTPKQDWELRAELKEAIRAEKRRTNPNYGTFMNVGGLFRDD